MREDRDAGYTEVLTMSATPSLTSDEPNDTEAISGLQTLRLAGDGRDALLPHGDGL